MESLCNQESPGTWPSCSPRVLRPGTRAAEPLVCPWAPGDPALVGRHSALSAPARGEM